MLILTRRQGEIVRIGDSIAVQILSISGEQVRLGFAAPKEVKVWRREVYVRLRAERTDKEKVQTRRD